MEWLKYLANYSETFNFVGGLDNTASHFPFHPSNDWEGGEVGGVGGLPLMIHCR
jgi:hypothetical protein